MLLDAASPGQPIVFANEGWEKITGYTLQEVIGKPSNGLLQVSRDSDSTNSVVFKQKPRSTECGSS